MYMKRFTILLSVLWLGSIVMMTSCSKEDDLPSKKIIEVYDEEHGNTNLGNMGVELNINHEFKGDYNVRVSHYGECQSLEDVDISFFHANFQFKAEMGHCYAATKYKYMFWEAGEYCAIPVGEKYSVFTPISPILEGDKLIGYKVEYEERMAQDYGLPEWWSTVATMNIGQENEIVITLPSENCICYSKELRLEQYTDKLKISLGKNTDFRGKAPLYIRIKESYTLVYVEVK